MMTIDKDSLFRNASGTSLPLTEVCTRILNYLGADPQRQYRLSVGTDSMTYQDTVFVLAIVVHKVGNGGIYFYRKMKHEAVKDLRSKLYAETQLSLDAIDLLVGELLQKDPGSADNVELSIHLDIGKNGPTKELIRELEGWVTAMGYDYAIKPDSYAASSIADIYSK
ncbi:MAG: ribonuclease H-like YkuK family protein [Erysipelotrichaceae bacterium]|nr:ribonuclease H-like YkuK family protein [Erysipelotrichaceae bacterium]